MVAYYSVYALTGIAGVAALSTMILRIGSVLAKCPKNGAFYQAAALAVATGYAAIGLGLVGLVGGGAFAYVESRPLALTVAFGVTSILLGLGFANAIATLRGVVPQPEDTPTQSS